MVFQKNVKNEKGAQNLILKQRSKKRTGKHGKRKRDSFFYRIIRFQIF